MVSEVELLRLNRVLEHIFNSGVRSGLSSINLVMLCWAASEGKDGFNFDSEFHRVVEDVFDRKPEYVGLYESLHAVNLKFSKDEFKHQLATRVGHFQLLYGLAVQTGYDGCMERLSFLNENVKWTVAYLQSKGVDGNTSLDKMVRIFFTGSPDATPAPVYTERIQKFQKALTFNPKYSEE